MIKVKTKLFYILLLLSILSFTSCSNNSLSESNIDTTEITETATEKNVGLSEMIETQETDMKSLSAVDFTQFKSMMNPDDYSELEKYFPVLSGDLKFNYQNQLNEKECREINLHELCEELLLMKLQMFTVCDLDNDGTKELILCLGNYTEQVIIHKENDDFFATSLWYRGFNCLQNNGIYISSGGASCSHYNKLSFEDGKFAEQELGHGCTYEDNIFTVNGNPVSEEEFQQWCEEILTGKVEWYYP